LPLRVSGRFGEEYRFHEGATLTTITTFMGQDHDALDATFEEFRGEADAGRAKRLFSDFAAARAHRLGGRHSVPAFEEMTGGRFRSHHGHARSTVVSKTTSIP
jgi:hypothetical protein